MNTALQKFCDFYQSDFAQADLGALAAIYSEDVVFCDPAHSIEGLDALTGYFAKLAKELLSCTFDIEHVAELDGEAFVIWTMTFRHASLKHGKEISVPGASHLRCTDKISYHRDYFDLGAMLYEQLPVLGHAIKLIKHRLGK